MTAARSVELPRLPVVDFKRLIGVLIFMSIAAFMLDDVLRPDGGTPYGMYAIMIVMMIVGLRDQRQAAVAVESKLRELGFSRPARRIMAIPPPAFLWNRSAATTRRSLMTLGIVFCVFPLIPTVSRLMREGRWPSTPPSLTWQSLKDFEFLAISAAAAIVICVLIRRHDASLARWERARAQASLLPGGGATALRRWPNVLFGADWQLRSGAIRDSWLASGWSSSEADSNYRALEQVVTWMHQADLIENARERMLYGDVLRKLAWRYALALDPTLANYS
jgi:hypothetical protein